MARSRPMMTRSDSYAISSKLRTLNWLNFCHNTFITKTWPSYAPRWTNSFSIIWVLITSKTWRMPSTVFTRSLTSQPQIEIWFASSASMTTSTWWQHGILTHSCTTRRILPILSRSFVMLSVRREDKMEHLRLRNSAFSNVSSSTVLR